MIIATQLIISGDTIMCYRNKIRIYTIFTILVIIPAAQSSQADEFGDRFYNKTPAGMADYTVDDNKSTDIADISMDDAAQQVQNIAPAAGDDNSEYEQPIGTLPENYINLKKEHNQ